MTADIRDLRARRAGPFDTYRMIPAAYPAIDLWADIASRADWADLDQIEMITNPRVRDERGEQPQLEVDKRASGEGARLVMAPFTHRNPDGSRFSDGSYGIYYCALDEETAGREVAYHRARFMAATAEAAQTLVCRTLAATLAGVSIDVYRRTEPWLRDPDDYTHCRELGALARGRCDFLQYESVRHPRHRAFAVFRPRALSNARHWAYWEMYWDGTAIVHVSRIAIHLREPGARL